MADRPAPLPEGNEFRTGAKVSGAVHAAVIFLAAVGTDWFGAAAPVPVAVTEVSLIDGARFDAAVATAPAPPSDTPDAPVAGAKDSAPAPATPEPRPEPRAAAPEPTVATEPEPAPQDAPTVDAPPPPTPVPSAEARPSIAEVPSPEDLARQAAEPESPAATEVVQPLASRAPVPGPRPGRPPDPEPEPAPEAEPEPEPETAEDAPTEVAETTPEAPPDAAPQEARLPVARPADRAAAARASRETRRPEPEPPAEAAPETATAEAAPDPAETAEAAPAARGADARAPRITSGERDALRLGLKRFFYYRGTRSDPRLAVQVAIELDRSGRIVSGPELVVARGGTEGERQILYRDARSALVRAMQAGVFAALPVEKFAAWRRINVTFTPEEIGVQS